MSLLIDHIEGQNLDLDQLFQDRGISVNEVPFVGRYRRSKSIALVVATAYLPLLSEKLPKFEIKRDYNPRVEPDFLFDATEATRTGWTPGAARCFCDAAISSRFFTALQESLLAWDLQVNFSTC